MLLVDVVKKKIYLHLKHLHLSCVRSRQLSPEHIKYRNRKPADLLQVLTVEPPIDVRCMCWWDYDMMVLMMLVSVQHVASVQSPGGRDMVAARTGFAVRGRHYWPGRGLESQCSDQSPGD